jgi:hypothetical protein
MKGKLDGPRFDPPRLSALKVESLGLTPTVPTVGGLNNGGLDANLRNVQRTLDKLFDDALKAEDKLGDELRQKLGPPPKELRWEDIGDPLGGVLGGSGQLWDR